MDNVCVKYTRQQAFTQMKDHMLKQRKRAWDNSVGSCSYHAPCGASCAIGALDKDSLFVEGETLGTNTITQLILQTKHHVQVGEEALCWELNRLHNITTLQAYGYPVEYGDLVFYERMQELHDGTRPHKWVSSLKEIAESFNLQY